MSILDRPLPQPSRLVLLHIPLQLANPIVWTMDGHIYGSRVTELDPGQCTDEAPEHDPEGPKYTANHASVDVMDVAFKKLDLAPSEAQIDCTTPKEIGCDHNRSLGNDFDYGFPTSTADEEQFRMKQEDGHSNDDDDVCQRCKSFRWDQIPYTQLPHETLLLIDMTKAQLAASHCRICRFVAKIIEAQHLPEDKHYSLVGFRVDSTTSNNFCSNIPNIQGKGNTGLAQIKPHDPETGEQVWTASDGEWNPFPHLAITDFSPEDNSVEKRSYKASHMKLDQIKGWIEDCHIKHRECYIGDVQHLLQNLRLIDCGSKTVVPAPVGCHYVALSYVWGQHNDAFDDLQNPPKTIEDSIYIAQMLGYRYLWIDRFVRTYHLSVHSLRLTNPVYRPE